MTAYTKEFITGAANGLGVKVAATATPGTLIHTAHATAKDEVWLEASNSDTVDRTLTLEWGGVTSPDNLKKFIIPAGDSISLSPGGILSNSLVIRGFANAANVITIHGYVNRVS